MRPLFIIVSAISLVFVLLGCQSSEKLEREAEQVAQAFSIAWQREDYGAVYDLIVPDLQTQRNKDEFINFVTASQEIAQFNLLYDKVVLQDKNLAYAYYTFSGEALFQPKVPALEMRRIDGQWKINALATYFTKECIIDDCRAWFKETLKSKMIPEMIYRCLQKRNYQRYVCEKSSEEAYAEIINSLVVKCDGSTGYVCKIEE